MRDIENGKIPNAKKHADDVVIDSKSQKVEEFKVEKKVEQPKVEVKEEKLAEKKIETKLE